MESPASKRLTTRDCCRLPIGDWHVPGCGVNTLGESYRGALLGTAIGDALGRPAEGMSPHHSGTPRASD